MSNKLVARTAKDAERPSPTSAASIAAELPAHDIAAQWFAWTKRWEPQPPALSRPLFRLTAVVVPMQSLRGAPLPAGILDVGLIAPTVLADVQRRTAVLEKTPDALTLAEVARALLSPDPSTAATAAAGAASEWIG